MVKAADSHDVSRRSLLLVMIACFAWMGCQHPSQAGGQYPEPVLPLSCPQLESSIDMRERIDTLRSIADAYYNGCYETVITYGTMAQSEYKYKTFSVHKEASNIFVPDGTWIDYVLESYERGFLTGLLAVSYHHLHNVDASKVELRRLDHEIFTPLYNYGADPVNVLVSAVMWEVLGEQDEARVDWNRLQGQEDLDEQIRAFASGRLNRMDAGQVLPGDWAIYAIGTFPGVEWDLQFIDSDSGYFSVRPQESFLPACASESGVRVSTAGWFEKIAMRHSHGYHPLLHLQSWLRLPIGLAYSITTFATGAGIAIGGCVLDVAAKGDGSLCKVSLQGGAALIRQSPKVLRGTLRPDLRHWDNVPSSFLFTTAPDLTDEPCFTSLSEQDQDGTTTFFGRD